MDAIVPNLWFDTEALEAAEFYVSLFPDSRVTGVTHYSAGGMREEGMVMTVEFELRRQPFAAINGGPQFQFNEAVSFAIPCADQAEADRFWEALTEDGEEGRCGWLKDRYGVSWQVYPQELEELLGDADPERAQRAMQAMLAMQRIDIAAVRAAVDGNAR